MNSRYPLPNTQAAAAFSSSALSLWGARGARAPRRAVFLVVFPELSFYFITAGEKKKKQSPPKALSPFCVAHSLQSSILAQWVCSAVGLGCSSALCEVRPGPSIQLVFTKSLQGCTAAQLPLFSPCFSWRKMLLIRGVMLLSVGAALAPMAAVPVWSQ